MGRTVEDLGTAADQAWSAAAAAAERSDVTLRILSTLDELRGAVEVFDSVWAKSGTDQVMPLGVLRALSHAGNYVSGAFASGKLVGALAGFMGGGDAEPHLHSHVLGVLPGARGGSVGFALKQHQRAWALQYGIGKITWTFDPLVSRNAYFNLTKLGAEASAYYPNFYGQMDDGINSGEESDRLLINWVVASPAATAAARGARRGPDTDMAKATGAVLALDEDGAEEPVTSAFDGASALLCKVPQDIVDLRIRSPEIARRWRQAQRAVFEPALRDGYRVEGVARTGWYLLTR